MDEQQIDVGGQRIAYARSEGQGRPVIFVHVNSSSARNWRQVMAGPFDSKMAARPGSASAMAHRPKTVTRLNLEHVLLRDKVARLGADHELEHVL